VLYVLSGIPSVLLNAMHTMQCMIDTASLPTDYLFVVLCFDAHTSHRNLLSRMHVM